MSWSVYVSFGHPCQKNTLSPTEKSVLKKVSVYSQLASSSSGNCQPDELTSGYSQLQNCDGFELMKCIPNCKVLEPLECQISAKNLKAAAGQGKIYIRQIQKSSQFYH